MIFLPIVSRELRVASRRHGTYWSRSVTAIIAIIAGVIAYLVSSDAPPHQLGTILFVVVSWVAFIYCLFVGVRHTADCLSEEKRDGTLGLLFLTDLKGYDVIAGKLFATSLNAFYGLMTVFPILAIPLLMGGLTYGELGRMALVLANTFLFSLGVGMFFSSVCQSPRKAMAATFLTLVMVSGGFVLLENWLPIFRHADQLRRWTMLISPGLDMFLANDTSFKTESNSFWESASLIHGVFWMTLAAASLIVPRSWQDHPAGESAKAWRSGWRRWSFGDGAERLVLRRRLLDVNAFYWLAARLRAGPLQVWLMLAAAAGLWCWAAVEYGGSWTNAGGYYFTAYVVNLVLKFWIASSAGHRLGEDRKLGALELLLSTRISVADILRGQLLALRRQFLGPVIVALIVQCLFLAAMLRTGNVSSEEEFQITAWSLALMIMLVADGLALAVVAMWVSLTARNPNRATGITVRRVLVLPLATGVGILIFTMIFILNSSNSAVGWKFLLGLWLVPGMLADLVFGLAAWHSLQYRFREAAARRYLPTPSFWQRVFGASSHVPAPTRPALETR